MPTAAQTQLARATVRKHGSKTRWKQRIKGGAKRVPAEFPKATLVRGVAVELEHTDDPLAAMEIAMDHLDEQLDYYEKLRKVEGNPHTETRAMNHPSFNVPAGISVAWSPEHAQYVALQGEGPLASRTVVAASADAGELQSWLDIAGRENNPDSDDIYQDMVDAGVKVEHHESDLYVPVSRTTTEILDRPQYARYRRNTRTFESPPRSGKIWYDIPFAYAPFWQGRRSNPYHGRKHNGAGLGAFLGSVVGGVAGAAIAGPLSPLASLLSIAGGGAGGFYGAQDDRKKRGAVGGAVGGILGPLFAALGGWIGGRKPDQHPTKHPRSLKATLMGNPEAAMSYDDALARIQDGDVEIAAAWIEFAGTETGDDPDIHAITFASLQLLRRDMDGIPVDIENMSTTTVRAANPPHEHKWWEAHGHCCEQCAIAQPCSGEEACLLANPTHFEFEQHQHAQPNPPRITASARRGACAAGTTKHKTARTAARKCDATKSDKAAFGKVGGKSSAKRRKKGSR